MNPSEAKTFEQSNFISRSDGATLCKNGVDGFTLVCYVCTDVPRRLGGVSLGF